MTTFRLVAAVLSTAAIAVEIPKYGEVFRANKVCADWQKLAGGK
ncbi:hypothetical protein [Lentzea sp. NPDC051838]